MAYYLGIDLGTTYTAAAIERDGLVEALTLGNRTASVPSVVFLRDDGEILVGEAATRRATSEPGRVGREFKRRVGDPTPLILGGTPYAAEMLMARMLRWAVDRVREQQGTDPLAIALTHPANWGPYKLDLLTQAVRQVDVNAALLLPEPVAAATFYASQRRLDPNAVVAVYDLGGGTFDAAMVRRTPTGFETVGSPEGIERLGGIDFDEAVYAHVRTAVGDALDQLDAEEPASVAATARLRQECIDAKEALSSDTDVSIPVLLPNLQTEVRLTRSEFEDMIRPAISETIVALRRSIRSAGVSDDQISAVLLVGGSSRIPLVAQMVAAELGRPIAIDAHPKDAISFGAAIAVAQKRGQATPESVKTVLPREQRPPPPTMAPGTTRTAPPNAASGAYRPNPPGAAVPGAYRPSPPAAAAQHTAARPVPPPARPSPPPARPATVGGAVAPTPQQQPQHHQQQPQQPQQPQQQNPAVAARQTAAPQTQTPRPTPPGASPMGGTPAAQRPVAAQRPAVQESSYANSGGYAASHLRQQAPPGGTPSGGWAAQRSSSAGGTGSGDENRTPLLIAIGVVAVVLALFLIMLVGNAGGGDDDDGGNADGSTTSTPDTQTIAEGYTPEMEADFLESCGGAAEDNADFCRCALDELKANIRVEDLAAAMDGFEAGGSGDLPPEIVSVVSTCLSEG